MEAWKTFPHRLHTQPTTLFEAGFTNRGLWGLLLCQLSWFRFPGFHGIICAENSFSHRLLSLILLTKIDQDLSEEYGRYHMVYPDEQIPICLYGLGFVLYAVLFPKPSTHKRFDTACFKDFHGLFSELFTRIAFSGLTYRDRSLFQIQRKRLPGTHMPADAFADDRQQAEMFSR